MEYIIVKKYINDYITNGVDGCRNTELRFVEIPFGDIANAFCVFKNQQLIIINSLKIYRLYRDNSKTIDNVLSSNKCEFVLNYILNFIIEAIKQICEVNEKKDDDEFLYDISDYLEGCALLDCYTYLRKRRIVRISRPVVFASYISKKTGRYSFQNFYCSLRALEGVVSDIEQNKTLSRWYEMRNSFYYLPELTYSKSRIPLFSATFLTEQLRYLFIKDKLPKLFSAKGLYYEDGTIHIPAMWKFVDDRKAPFMRHLLLRLLIYPELNRGEDIFTFFSESQTAKDELEQYVNDYMDKVKAYIEAFYMDNEEGDSFEFEKNIASLALDNLKMIKKIVYKLGISINGLKLKVKRGKIYL